MTHPARLVLIALLAALALVLCLYAAAGAFMRMEADDYCHAADALEYGVLGSIKHSYETWSGRYSHLLVAGVLWPLFRETLPAVTPAILLAALALSLTWALRPITPHALLYALTLTVAVVAAASEQSLWAALYWTGASLTYIAPLVVAVLLVGVLLRPTNRLRLIAAFALGFLFAGFNETTAVLGLAALFVGLVMTRKTSVLPALLGVVLGFTLVTLAPGNAVRGGYLPPSITRLNVQWAGGQAVVDMLGVALGSLVHAPLALALAFAGGWSLAPRNSSVRPLRHRPLWIVVAVAFTLAAVALVLLPAYAVIGWVAPRVYFVATAVAVAGTAGVGYVVGSCRPQETAQRVLPALALIVCLSTAGWFVERLPDLAGYARLHDAGALPTLMDAWGELGPPTTDWMLACRERYQGVISSH